VAKVGSAAKVATKEVLQVTSRPCGGGVSPHEPLKTVGQRNPNHQVIDDLFHYFVWVSTILLVVQDFATIHSMVG
jgi:hypothetical protein